MLPVSEGASIGQTAGLVLFKVPAQRRLVFDVSHLVLIVALLEVDFFTSLTVLVALMAPTLVLIAAILLLVACIGVALLSLLSVVSSAVVVGVLPSAQRIASGLGVAIALVVFSLSLSSAALTSE